MLESTVERYFVQRVRDCGGLAEKFTSPGRRHVPDRLVTLPNVPLHLVELKRPGEKPRPGQVRDHARRAALGHRVYVIDSLGAVNKYISNIRKGALT